jgi:hypothetical protein
LEKNGGFCSKYYCFLAKIVSQLWFVRKTPIFCRKFAKIAEICDDNIETPSRKTERNGFV